MYQAAQLLKRTWQYAGFHVLIIPLKHHDKVYGAVELAGLIHLVI
jgi:hypothetical protein